MRVSGGSLRGRVIATPRGSSTRPTSGRLKKSLLDVLSSRLPGALVLDLYAGAGALAIEALSRGAARAVLVERDRNAAAVIRRNLRELGLEASAELIQKDVLTAAARLAGPFDIVLADPPYRSDEAERLLQLLASSRLVAEGGWVAVEHHHKTPLAERYGELVALRALKAGESRVTLFARAAPEP